MNCTSYTYTCSSQCYTYIVPACPVCIWLVSHVHCVSVKAPHTDHTHIPTTGTTARAAFGAWGMHEAGGGLPTWHHLHRGPEETPHQTLLCQPGGHGEGTVTHMYYWVFIYNVEKRPTVIDEWTIHPSPSTCWVSKMYLCTYIHHVYGAQWLLLHSMG